MCIIKYNLFAIFSKFIPKRTLWNRIVIWFRNILSKFRLTSLKIIYNVLLNDNNFPRNFINNFCCCRGKIHYTEMYDMLKNMDPPLGFGNKCPNRLAYKKLIRMNMPVDSDGRVSFTTTFFALIRENLNIKMRSGKFKFLLFQIYQWKYHLSVSPHWNAVLPDCQISAALSIHGDRRRTLLDGLFLYHLQKLQIPINSLSIFYTGWYFGDYINYWRYI